MIITEKTTYYCNGKQFNTNEEAQEYCEERLAEAICNLVAATLSPKEKLLTLERIHRMTFKERQWFADLFIVVTE